MIDQKPDSELRTSGERVAPKHTDQRSALTHCGRGGLRVDGLRPRVWAAWAQEWEGTKFKMEEMSGKGFEKRQEVEEWAEPSLRSRCDSQALVSYVRSWRKGRAASRPLRAHCHWRRPLCCRSTFCASGKRVPCASFLLSWPRRRRIKRPQATKSLSSP